MEEPKYILVPEDFYLNQKQLFAGNLGNSNLVNSSLNLRDSINSQTNPTFINDFTSSARCFCLDNSLAQDFESVGRGQLVTNVCPNVYMGKPIFKEFQDSSSTFPDNIKVVKCDGIESLQLINDDKFIEYVILFAAGALCSDSDVRKKIQRLHLPVYGTGAVLRTNIESGFITFSVGEDILKQMKRQQRRLPPCSEKDFLNNSTIIK